VLSPGFGHAEEASAREEARAYFKEGLRHADHGEVALAIDAFEKAYRASPNYAVLYNLALAYGDAGRRIDEVQTFERFLAEGGDQIPAERRAEVKATIERERAHIATIELDIAPARAEVFVDGRELGTGPFVSLDLEPGHHVVFARQSGFVPEVLDIELEPGKQNRAKLTLKPERGSSFAVAAATSAPPALRAEPSMGEPASAMVADDPHNHRRTWALGLGAGGLALAGAAIGTYVWNTKRYHSWQADRDQFENTPVNGNTLTELNSLYERSSELQRADNAALGLALAAGAALTSAVVLWFTSPRSAGGSTREHANAP
jgi:hypothetical protein